MSPTITPAAFLKQDQKPSTAFRAAFRAHLRVSGVRVATAKTVPSVQVSPSDMGAFPFFTPPDCLCAALVVDVDRDGGFAGIEADIFDTIPREITPSWIILTTKGAQVGWMIETVDLRESARIKPIEYARAVGGALRAALDGDPAVDPVSAPRVRNPAYEGVYPLASGQPPVYSLGELRTALQSAGLWAPPKFSPEGAAASVATKGVLLEGTRNNGVFDACRFAAYAGRDHDAAAWNANDRCEPPLPASEVKGIIRSVDRFMSDRRSRYSGTGNMPMPEAMHELLSEMGRRGGLANTPAQRAARALGPAAAAETLKERTDTDARSAQKLRAQGHSAASICQRLKAARSTVYRWLRRHVRHTPRVPHLDHQVITHPRPRSPRCSLVQSYPATASVHQRSRPHYGFRSSIRCRLEPPSGPPPT